VRKRSGERDKKRQVDREKKKKKTAVSGRSEERGGFPAKD
jgi:hypothetical protein